MPGSDPAISQADEDEAREHAYMLITLALHHESPAALLAEVPNPEHVAAVVLGAFQAAWEWFARVTNSDPIDLWQGYREASALADPVADLNDGDANV